MLLISDDVDTDANDVPDSSQEPVDYLDEVSEWLLEAEGDAGFKLNVKGEQGYEVLRMYLSVLPQSTLDSEPLFTDIVSGKLSYEEFLEEYKPEGTSDHDFHGSVFTIASKDNAGTSTSIFVDLHAEMFHTYVSDGKLCSDKYTFDASVDILMEKIGDRMFLDHGSLDFVLKFPGFESVFGGYVDLSGITESELESMVVGNWEGIDVGVLVSSYLEVKEGDEPGSEVYQSSDVYDLGVLEDVSNKEGVTEGNDLPLYWPVMNHFYDYYGIFISENLYRDIVLETVDVSKYLVDGDMEFYYDFAKEGTYNISLKEKIENELVEFPASVPMFEQDGEYVFSAYLDTEKDVYEIELCRGVSNAPTTLFGRDVVYDIEVVDIGGITYELHTGGYCKVISVPSEINDLIVPRNVHYEGRTYSVDGFDCKVTLNTLDLTKCNGRLELSGCDVENLIFNFRADPHASAWDSLRVKNIVVESTEWGSLSLYNLSVAEGLESFTVVGPGNVYGFDAPEGFVGIGSDVSVGGLQYELGYENGPVAEVVGINEGYSSITIGSSVVIGDIKYRVSGGYFAIKGVELDSLRIDAGDKSGRFHIWSEESVITDLYTACETEVEGKTITISHLTVDSTDLRFDGVDLVGPIEVETIGDASINGLAAPQGSAGIGSIVTVEGVEYRSFLSDGTTFFRVVGISDDAKKAVIRDTLTYNGKEYGIAPWNLEIVERGLMELTIDCRGSVEIYGSHIDTLRINSSVSIEGYDSSITNIYADSEKPIYIDASYLRLDPGLKVFEYGDSVTMYNFVYSYGSTEVGSEIEIGGVKYLKCLNEGEICLMPTGVSDDATDVKIGVIEDDGNEYRFIEGKVDLSGKVLNSVRLDVGSDLILDGAEINLLELNADASLNGENVKINVIEIKDSRVSMYNLTLDSLGRIDAEGSASLSGFTAPEGYTGVGGIVSIDGIMYRTGLYYGQGYANILGLDEGKKTVSMKREFNTGGIDYEVHGAYELDVSGVVLDSLTVLSDMKVYLDGSDIGILTIISDTPRLFDSTVTLSGQDVKLGKILAKTNPDCSLIISAYNFCPVEFGLFEYSGHVFTEGLVTPADEGVGSIVIHDGVKYSVRLYGKDLCLEVVGPAGESKDITVPETVVLDGGSKEYRVRGGHLDVSGMDLDSLSIDAAIDIIMDGSTIDVLNIKTNSTFKGEGSKIRDINILTDDHHDIYVDMDELSLQSLVNFNISGNVTVQDFNAPENFRGLGSTRVADGIVYRLGIDRGEYFAKIIGIEENQTIFKINPSVTIQQEPDVTLPVRSNYLSFEDLDISRLEVNTDISIYLRDVTVEDLVISHSSWISGGDVAVKRIVIRADSDITVDMRSLRLSPELDSFVFEGSGNPTVIGFRAPDNFKGFGMELSYEGLDYRVEMINGETVLSVIGHDGKSKDITVDDKVIIEGIEYRVAGGHLDLEETDLDKLTVNANVDISLYKSNIGTLEIGSDLRIHGKYVEINDINVTTSEELDLNLGSLHLMGELNSFHIGKETSVKGFVAPGGFSGIGSEQNAAGVIYRIAAVDGKEVAYSTGIEDGAKNIVLPKQISVDGRVIDVLPDSNLTIDGVRDSVTICNYQNVNLEHIVLKELNVACDSNLYGESVNITNMLVNSEEPFDLYLGNLELTSGLESFLVGNGIEISGFECPEGFEGIGTFKDVDGVKYQIISKDDGFIAKAVSISKDGEVTLSDRVAIDGCQYVADYSDVEMNGLNLVRLVINTGCNLDLNGSKIDSLEIRIYLKLDKSPISISLSGDVDITDISVITERSLELHLDDLNIKQLNAFTHEGDVSVHGLKVLGDFTGVGSYKVFYGVRYLHCLENGNEFLSMDSIVDGTEDVEFRSIIQVDGRNLKTYYPYVVDLSGSFNNVIVEANQLHVSFQEGCNVVNLTLRGDLYLHGTDVDINSISVECNENGSVCDVVMRQLNLNPGLESFTWVGNVSVYGFIAPEGFTGIGSTTTVDGIIYRSFIKSGDLCYEAIDVESNVTDVVVNEFVYVENNVPTNNGYRVVYVNLDLSNRELSSVVIDIKSSFSYRYGNSLDLNNSNIGKLSINTDMYVHGNDVLIQDILVDVSEYESVLYMDKLNLIEGLNSFKTIDNVTIDGFVAPPGFDGIGSIKTIDGVDYRETVQNGKKCFEAVKITGKSGNIRVDSTIELNGVSYPVMYSHLSASELKLNELFIGVEGQVLLTNSEIDSLIVDLPENHEYLSLEGHDVSIDNIMLDSEDESRIDIGDLGLVNVPKSVVINGPIDIINQVNLDGQTFEYGGVTYELYDDWGIIVAKLSNPVYDTISVHTDHILEIEGKNVLIHIGAFDCSGLEDVIGITFVGSGFTVLNSDTDLANLTTLEFKDYVTSIEEGAFEYSTSLDEVIFNSVGTIESAAFGNCDLLEKLTFNGYVGCIESDAFVNCSEIKEITFSSDVGVLENDAFGPIGNFPEAGTSASTNTDGSDETSFKLVFGGHVEKYISPLGGSGLTSLTFKKGVDHLYVDECEYLTSIVVEGDLGSIYLNSVSNLSIFKVNGDIDRINEAFSYCDFKEFVVTGSIGVMEECAFWECTFLNEGTITEIIEKSKNAHWRSLVNASYHDLNNDVVGYNGMVSGHNLIEAKITNSDLDVSVMLYKLDGKYVADLRYIDFINFVSNSDLTIDTVRVGNTDYPVSVALSQGNCDNSPEKIHNLNFGDNVIDFSGGVVHELFNYNDTGSVSSLFEGIDLINVNLSEKSKAYESGFRFIDSGKSGTPGYHCLIRGDTLVSVFDEGLIGGKFQVPDGLTDQTYYSMDTLNISELDTGDLGSMNGHIPDSVTSLTIGKSLSCIDWNHVPKYVEIDPENEDFYLAEDGALYRLNWRHTELDRFINRCTDDGIGSTVFELPESIGECHVSGIRDYAFKDTCITKVIIKHDIEISRYSFENSGVVDVLLPDDISYFEIEGIKEGCNVHTVSENVIWTDNGVVYFNQSFRENGMEKSRLCVIGNTNEYREGIDIADGVEHVDLSWFDMYGGEHDAIVIIPETVTDCDDYRPYFILAPEGLELSGNRVRPYTTSADYSISFDYASGNSVHMMLKGSCPMIHITGVFMGDEQIYESPIFKNPEDWDSNTAPVSLDITLDKLFPDNNDALLPEITVKYEKFEHTVVFSTGDMTVETKVQHNDRAVIPGELLNAGYGIDRWFTDSELTQIYDFETKVCGKITLYAGNTPEIPEVPKITVTVPRADTIENPDPTLPPEPVEPEPVPPSPPVLPDFETGPYTVTFVNDPQKGDFEGPSTLKVWDGYVYLPNVESKEGYQFMGWVRNGLFTDYNYSYADVSSDVVYTAMYISTQPEVEVEYDVDPQKGVLNGDSKVVYKDMSMVIFPDVTAESGCKFIGWNDGQRTYSDGLYVVSDDVTLTAVFENDPIPEEHKVVITETSGGKVTATPMKGAAGTQITITVVPEAGMELEELTINGEELEIDGNTYTFSMPDSDVTVTAEFDEAEPEIKYIYVTGDYEREYEVGDELDTDGIEVYAVFSDGESKDVTDDCSFSPTKFRKAGNVTVTVSYMDKTTSFTVNVKDDGSVSPGGPGEGGGAGKDPVLLSINVVLGKDVYEVGDEIDDDDVVVFAVYSDGKQTDVTDDCEFYPDEFDKPGSVTVTVTYMGKTATFNVTVQEDDDDDAPEIPETPDVPGLENDDDETPEIVDGNKDSSTQTDEETGKTTTNTTETGKTEDGKDVEIKTETVVDKDGNKVEKKDETITDVNGNRVEKESETTVNKDGSSSRTESVTETSKDGSKVETDKTLTVDSKGQITENTTTKKTDASGKEQTIEKNVVTEVNPNGETTVTATETVRDSDGNTSVKEVESVISKDKDGKVTESAKVTVKENGKDVKEIQNVERSSHTDADGNTTETENVTVTDADGKVNEKSESTVVTDRDGSKTETTVVSQMDGETVKESRETVRTTETKDSGEVVQTSTETVKGADNVVRETTQSENSKTVQKDDRGFITEQKETETKLTVVNDNSGQLSHTVAVDTLKVQNREQDKTVQTTQIKGANDEVKKTETVTETVTKDKDGKHLDYTKELNSNEKTDAGNDMSVKTTIKTDSSGKTVENTEINSQSEDGDVETSVVSNTDASGRHTATSETTMKTETKDGGEVSVGDDVVTKAVVQIKEATDGIDADKTIRIDAPKDERREAKMSISSKSMDAISGSGAELKLSGNVGSISVGSDITKNLSEKAGSSDDEVKMSLAIADKREMNDHQKHRVGDREVFHLSAKAGGESIHDLGGKATITVPYTPKAGEDLEHITVFYVNDKGELYSRTTSYDPVTHTVTFKTDHFSYYMIGTAADAYEEEPDNTVVYLAAGAAVAIAAIVAVIFIRRRV